MEEVVQALQKSIFVGDVEIPQMAQSGGIRLLNNERLGGIGIGVTQLDIATIARAVGEKFDVMNAGYGGKVVSAPIANPWKRRLTFAIAIESSLGPKPV